MQRVQVGAQDEIETVHLYVVREHEKKPYTLLPLLCALLCMAGIAAVTCYSAQHPYYEHQRLTVPAVLLPLKTFTAKVAIIPTGVRVYPATTAHGVLTITNGSVIPQTLPAGLILLGNTGVQVATDAAVFVPAGSANGYGFATVAAHALVSGKGGNVATFAINQVEGSSVYVRNLAAFQGGRDAYSVKFITSNDRNVAFSKTRNILISKITGLHYPCTDDHIAGAHNMIVTWRCQFLTYHVPSYMHITGVRIIGKNLLLDVWFVTRPIRVWVK
jgi:hypothetical protein